MNAKFKAFLKKHTQHIAALFLVFATGACTNFYKSTELSPDAIMIRELSRKPKGCEGLGLIVTPAIQAKSQEDALEMVRTYLRNITAERKGNYFRVNKFFQMTGGYSAYRGEGYGYKCKN